MTTQTLAKRPEGSDVENLLTRYFVFWHAGPASEEEIVRYFTEDPDRPTENDVRSALQKFVEDKFEKRSGNGQSGDPYIYEYTPDKPPSEVGSGDKRGE